MDTSIRRTSIVLAVCGTLLLACDGARAQTPGESRVFFSLSPARIHPGAGLSSLAGLSLRTAESPELSPPDTSGGSHTGIRLLPDHLSPMESILWGEGGLLRKVGIAPLTPGARKSELAFRRTLLTLHQIGGFATLGLMIPTLVLGQRNIANWNNASDGTAPFDRQLDRNHKSWAGITFAAYMATASFSILSPPPLIRRDEGTNTITIHKTLAWVHFTCMIATPILGMLASHARTTAAARDYRTAHQVTAYVTAAALTASMIVITF